MEIWGPYLVTLSSKVVVPQLDDNYRGTSMTSAIGFLSQDFSVPAMDFLGRQPLHLLAAAQLVPTRKRRWSSVRFLCVRATGCLELMKAIYTQFFGWRNHEKSILGGSLRSHFKKHDIRLPLIQ